MSFKFDHRLLAGEMEIYFLDEQIGAGLPVWLPNGVAIRDALEKFVKQLEHRDGYQRVSSPHLGKAVLFEKSGHLKHYADEMYPPFDGSYLKPMNCPYHHKVFESQPRSFRQLPLRIAEYGHVYRFENSGSLRGLSRARSLSQNDAHIYVEPARALDEIKRVMSLHEECYEALGLKNYSYRLSLPDASYDLSRVWEEAENILREALGSRDYRAVRGEAAFYGPKIDVQHRLANGNEESIASIQLDFFSAVRFDLKYIDRDGQPQRPWIIHRAPLGSHERIVSLLLEIYDGQIPGWLSPVQVAVLPAREEHLEKARAIHEKFLAERVRSRLDVAQGSLSKRIKAIRKLRPFSRLVVGDEDHLKLELRDGSQVPIAELSSKLICPQPKARAPEDRARSRSNSGKDAVS